MRRSRSRSDERLPPGPKNSASKPRRSQKTRARRGDLSVIVPATDPVASRLRPGVAAVSCACKSKMPEQVSSYRLESEIARGGMGIVYRGVNTVFDEVVAIKAIFPELTLNPELRTRFANKAKIQRRLQHPNIVQIREFLVDQGRFYIVMELIEGETRRHPARRGASEARRRAGRPPDLWRASRLAAAGAAFARRGAARSGPRRRGRKSLPRGFEPPPQQRLVTVQPGEKLGSR